jgi:hypothetical protein
MALIKELETGFGVNATYWNITQTRMNYNGKSCTFQLAGFKDKAARESGKSALLSKEFRFLLADWTPEMNLQAKGYACIKAEEIQPAREAVLDEEGNELSAAVPAELGLFADATDDL